MDLTSTIIILFAAYQLYSDKVARDYLKKIICTNKYLVYVTLAWFINLFIGYALSPVHNTDWFKYFTDAKYLVLALSLLIVYHNFYWEERHLRLIFILFLIVCLLSFPIYFLSDNPYKRLDGFFNNPMTTAHSYGFVFLLCLCHLISKSSQIKTLSQINKVYFFTISIGGLAMLLTSTRGVWLALGVSSLVVAGLYSSKLFYTLLAISSSFFLALMSFSTKFRDRILYTFSTDNYDHNRWNLWLANFEIIKKYPLFGVGYGENKKLLQDIYTNLEITDFTMISHAHNQFIHWTAGTGFLGLTLMLLFLFLILKKYQSMKKQDQSENQQTGAFLLVGSIVYFLIGGLFEANFEHSKIKYMLTFAITFSFLLSKNGKQDQSHKTI